MKSRVSVIALIAGLCALPPSSAYGREGAAGNAAAPAPQFSLSVSPTRIVVAADQLDQAERITVTNRGREPIQVRMAKRDFEQAADGAPRFVSAAPYSAGGWVTPVPDSFPLPPGGSRQVTLRIAVPPAPEAGEHQVAIISSVPAVGAGPGIHVSRGVGIALYVTVPGPVDDSAQIADLSAPGFAVGGPITLTAAIHDAGTVHRDFSGPNRLTADAHGDSVAFPNFLVLRAATRVVSAQWTDPPLFCVCHATVSIRDPRGRESTATVTVVVFPLPLVLSLLAGLFLLWIGLWWARRHYRAHVLAAARRLRREDDAED